MSQHNVSDPQEKRERKQEKPQAELHAWIIRIINHSWVANTDWMVWDCPENPGLKPSCEI